MNREALEALAGDILRVSQDAGDPNKPAVEEGYALDFYPVRWKRYKPQGARQMGRLGRWQRMNEYGGWDNCAAPRTVYPSELIDALSAALIAQTEEGE